MRRIFRATIDSIMTSKLQVAASNQLYRRQLKQDDGRTEIEILGGDQEGLGYCFRSLWQKFNIPDLM